MSRNAPKGQEGPEAIFDVARGFMAAKALMTACEVGLFAALDRPADADELASRCGLTARAARLLANALVATDFLELNDNQYKNSAVAEAWLSGRSPFDLSPMMSLMNHVTFPQWQYLDEAVATGAPIDEASRHKEEHRQVYSRGMAAIVFGTAQALAAAYDFSVHQRLLDIGGGTGNFSASILRAFPELQATVFDLPHVAAQTRELLDTQRPHGGRMGVAAGDVFVDSLPVDHDVILAANFLHQFSAEQNRDLLRRLREAVQPGVRLLLIDFWTDSTGTAPPLAALSGLQFLITTEGGSVYSVEDAQEWLGETGWTFLRLVPLAGMSALVVAEAC